MCDYSLENYSSRPARDFERYETTRFASGSIGLASPGDCRTAVCVAYDTTLMLEKIPADFQARIGVGPVSEARFVRLDQGAYRDGVVFANGKRASLQQLGVGVTAMVVDRAPTMAGILDALPAMV